MSKIFGNKETINRAKNAKPGDKSTYINFEAINDLPEGYEVVVTEVKFDPKNLGDDFSNVGSKEKPKWMPQPHLMYKIAEACGISGGDDSIVEPLMETVDVNDMAMKPIDAEPTYRKMKVGAKVVKYATRIQEDGTPLRSSQCTIEFNVWDRCLELWSKEEMYTDGYTKSSKYPNKYDTPHKRKAHFQSEMKFAHAKAETKAYLKAIRELAGLMTGYKTEDLKDGILIFSKIRRSREVLRMETAARLQAISRGNGSTATAMLFGDTAPESLPDITTEPEPEPEPDIFDAEPGDPEKSNQDKFIAALNEYIKNDLIVSEQSDTAMKLLNWLTGTPDAENSNIWSKAIKKLEIIEQKIPEEGRVDHNLY